MLPGIQEFLIIIAIILVLSMTGLWPTVVRGLREFRGETFDDQPNQGAAPSKSDVEMCYRMLGLSPSAPWPDIERAYKKKAKIHHPDHGGDEDTMRALNEAYQTLKRIKAPKR